MTTEIKPRIISAHDTARFEGGRVADVTVIRFMVGEFGPFEAVVPRGTDRYAIEAAMRVRAETLTGNV